MKQVVAIDEPLMPSGGTYCQNQADRMAARGLPVNGALENGQLKLFTSEETYTVDGYFDSTRVA